MTKPTTCDYELSKKLYDMGITGAKALRIDSLFYWVIDDNKTTINLAIKCDTLNHYKLIGRHDNTLILGESNLIPAPMLHELLDVMPRHLEKKYPKDNASYTIGLAYDGWGKWECRYSDVFPVDGTVYLCKHADPNPANAVAKTLIWLVENKYISVEEINNG